MKANPWRRSCSSSWWTGYKLGGIVALFIAEYFKIGVTNYLVTFLVLGILIF